MKDIIKRILKEFVEESGVSIQILGVSYPLLIDEGIKPYVPRESVLRVKEFIKSNSPFVGKFIDKKTGQEKSVKFHLDVTDHFINRMYRQRDPEYKMGGPKFNPSIVNPGNLEGLTMIVDNADKLAEQILIGQIKDEYVVQMSAKGPSQYSVIVKFEKMYGKNTEYKLILTTQIKGVEFYNKKHQSKLNLNTYR